MVQRGGIVQFALHLGQVGSGAKMFALRPDQDRPDIRVRLEFLNARARNALMHLKRQAIELLGARQLDNADAALGRLLMTGALISDAPFAFLSYCSAIAAGLFAGDHKLLDLCAVPSPICRPSTSL